MKIVLQASLPLCEHIAKARATDEWKTILVFNHLVILCVSHKSTCFNRGNVVFSRINAICLYIRNCSFFAMLLASLQHE